MVCIWCMKPVVALRSSKRFCGDACRQAYWRSRQQLRAWGIPEQPVCHLGRFEDYAHDYAGRLDVIITDPPYSRRYLPLYTALGQFALTALKPGGWLLCVTGWGTDFEVRTSWNAAGLEFVTEEFYRMPEQPGDGTRPTSVGVLLWKQYEKPILWYQKPGTRGDRRRGVTRDRITEPVISTPEMNQKQRRWEQSVSAFRQIVRKWTVPSDLICDPMMGWGTTPVACVSENRPRCIGIEVRPERYAYACQQLGLTPAQAAD